MATYSYTVTASGNDHYLWSGHGLVDAPDPSLSFQDGDVITITNVSGGHIMRLIPDNDPSGSVDASAGNNGTTFLFFDPMLEGSYTYVCTSHPSMTGSITVYKKHTGQGSTHRYLVEIDSSQDKYLWYDGLEVIDGAIRSVNTEPNFLGDAPSINIPVGDTLQIYEYRSAASFSQLELSATPTIKNIKRAYRVILNREFDVTGLNHYYGNSIFPTLFDVVVDMGGSPEYLNKQSRLYYHLMRISLLSGVDVARMDDWESYVRSREDLLNSWDPVNGGTLSDFGENHAKSEGSYKAYPLLSHTFQEIQSITYRPIHGNFDQGENIISVFNRKPLSLASRKVSIENVRSKINDIINSGDQSVSIGDEPQDPRSGDIWFNGSSLMIYLGLDLITEDGQNSFVTEEDLINLDLERISPWFEISGDSGSGPTASIISYAGSSSSIAPAGSQGDLWYDSANLALNVFNGSTWEAVAAGDKWSSGWVSEGVSNGASLTFDHNLGSEDYISQIYMAKDAFGTDAVSVSNVIHRIEAPNDHQFGAQIYNATSTSLKVALSQEGWVGSRDPVGTQPSITGNWGTMYTHIKVVVRS